MSKNVFFQVAIYACTCCGRKEEFVSLKQWMKKERGKCNECGKSDVEIFEADLLYFYDPEENYLFPATPDVPKSKTGCKEHHGADKMHWTEGLIFCTHCDGFLMQFVEYTDGLYPEAYKKFAIEESKLRAPDVLYNCKDGKQIYTSEFDFRAN